MSAMSELYLDILDMLEQGVYPPKIALTLGCPLSMVYDVNETRTELSEELSPYETINS